MIAILSAASAEHLMIWASFLIMAKMAARVLLRWPLQSQTKPVPVPSNARRPIPCAAPRLPWR